MPSWRKSNASWTGGPRGSKHDGRTYSRIQQLFEVNVGNKTARAVHIFVGPLFVKGGVFQRIPA